MTQPFDGYTLAYTASKYRIDRSTSDVQLANLAQQLSHTWKQVRPNPLDCLLLVRWYMQMTSDPDDLAAAAVAAKSLGITGVMTDVQLGDLAYEKFDANVGGSSYYDRDVQRLLWWFRYRAKMEECFPKTLQTCRTAVALAKATPRSSTTPVGWCSKEVAEHLMMAPAVASTGAIFVNAGSAAPKDMYALPCYGTCGKDFVATMPSTRGEVMDRLVWALSQVMLQPDHEHQQAPELAAVVGAFAALP